MTEWALHTLIATSALLALVLLLRRPVAKRFGPRVAYALWLLPVLRIVTPGISLPAAWLPERAAETVAPTAPTQVLMQPASTPPTPSAFPSEQIWTALLVVWAVVAVFWLIKLTLSHQRYRAARLSQSSPPSARLDRLAKAVASDVGLRRAPDLRVAEDATGPLVTGLARPLIVLPLDAEEDFTPEQLRLALLHETLHIRRGDLWTASLMASARAVFWWHPLVHLAWPRFRADQEAACDAHLIRVAGESARASYAATLLRAARLSGGANLDIPGAALALSLHHPVKERLMTLAQTKTRSGRWSLAAALLAGAALCAPLSVADPVKTDVENTDARTIVIGDAVKMNLRSKHNMETGENTFYRVEADGSRTELTEDEFRAAMQSSIQDTVRSLAKRSVPGEPGLTALQSGGGARTIIVNTADANAPLEFQDVKSFELKIASEDGEEIGETRTIRTGKMSFTLPEGEIAADADHADFAESLSGRLPDELIAKLLKDHMADGGDSTTKIARIVQRDEDASEPFRLVSRVDVRDDKKGIRLTSEDGGQTFTRTDPDGTTEVLTRAELKQRHGIDMDVMDERLENVHDKLGSLDGKVQILKGKLSATQLDESEQSEND